MTDNKTYVGRVYGDRLMSLGEDKDIAVELERREQQLETQLYNYINSIPGATHQAEYCLRLHVLFKDIKHDAQVARLNTLIDAGLAAEPNETLPPASG